MSKINVDTWEPESGSAATLMATGDTVTLPSGAILAVASGGDINVLSGGEIDIASGATLDVNGTIDLTGATKTGFPAGGLTNASQWRIDTDLSVGTSYVYFYANWEKPAAAEFPGTIGSDMVVDSTTSATLSGAWTFPVTGTWYVRFFWAQITNTVNHDYTTKLYVTDDNGANWVDGARNSQGGTTGMRVSGTVEYIFNVADVANDKIRSAAKASAGTNTVMSEPDYTVTGFTFLRLGDAS